ncbi:type IX secretion system membrane protein PorP/SprF [Parabacteroides sp. 52]|uniref:PorP/SprF family type IX secretion system membrane protein n=1 Tax=unclassified Parabacteroides TaxID=2649774 RepID=UPI0013D68490|nr:MULTISPECIES: type IX secretion system membrane protein PorP/SprF [unclassified Parabacteroides]MDH6535522.1 type IX secretion system PorP/SprF family membrane protein [Parabacteroides sp. PM5-20]NDV56393.1 type IX secretion system membrane protein PorP/SprF [Parabacteroides sp. 52]
MRRVLLSILVIICTCAGLVRAQDDAQFTQYFMAMGYYNPGFVGTSEDLNMFALHRQQFVGFKRNPRSFFVMADMPMKFGQTNHGVGVVFSSESAGLYQNSMVSVQYAYKHKLFGGELSIGVQAGLAMRGFDGDSVYIPNLIGSGGDNQIDGAIPLSKVKGNAVDFNAGIYYTHKKFYAGFGLTHILEPEVKLTESSHIYIGRAFNLTGGYNIQLENPLYELQPSVFVQTDMQSYQADITARLVYNKMFDGGVSWRTTKAMIVMLGATFGRFHVGYSYDYSYSPIRKGTSGSHEIMMKYSLKLKKTKTGKNRHKSVRIL